MDRLPEVKPGVAGVRRDFKLSTTAFANPTPDATLTPPFPAVTLQTRSPHPLHSRTAPLPELRGVHI